MASIRRYWPFPLLVAASLATRAARADDVPTFADRPDNEVEDRHAAVALLSNPLAAATGVFGLEADFVLASKLALAVGGDVYRLADAPGAALSVGLLAYPFSRALRGFYVEPRVTYARPMKGPLVRLDWDADVVALGGAGGYQWTWDYGLSLRIGIGVQTALAGSFSGMPGQLFGLGGAELVADTSLGWSW
jgi:hypothetical protein